MASSSPHNHEGSALPGKNLGLNPETVANLTLQSVKGLSWVWTGLPIDITNKTLAYWTNSQKILNIQPEPPWFGGPYWGYHNRGLRSVAKAAKVPSKRGWRSSSSRLTSASGAASHRLSTPTHSESQKTTHHCPNKSHKFNGHFRILKWRYCTI